MSPLEEPEAPAPPPPAGRARPPGFWLVVTLPVHALLLALASAAPAAVEAVYGRRVFPLVAWLQAQVDRTALSPGLVLLGLLLGAIGHGAWRARRRAGGGALALLRALSWRLLVGVALVGHTFPWAWGLNYLRPPLATRLGLDPEADPASFPTTATRVVEATNQARLEWGAPDLDRLERRVDRAVRALLAGLALDEASHPRRGRFLPRGVMAAGGWHGVTIPWTTEACVDPATDPRYIPHAIAHEKAHQAGFAREADANFIAFLALARDPDPHLRYSTLFYVVDLFLDDSSVPLVTEVQQDAAAAVAHEAATAVPVVAEVTHETYDTYLKVAQVEPTAGVADYDRVAGLIHAWLRERPGFLDPLDPHR